MISVLLIDDDPDLLEIIRMEIGNETDFDLQTCTLPKDAIKLVRSEKFDSVVCDFTMPGIDGCSLLQILRSHGYTGQFILYSGKEPDDEITRALTRGLDVYLQRKGNPFEGFRELKRIIRAAVHSEGQNPL